MRTVQGYYDGRNIRLMEDIVVKPNQRVIITLIDDDVEPVKLPQKRSLRGILSDYADPALAEKERGAWERAAEEKHGTL